MIAYQGLFFAVADYAHTVPVLKPTEVEGIFAALLRSKHIMVSSETTDARLHCASSGNYHGSYRKRDLDNRAALSSSTPAPFTAIRWERLMNAQLHPRTLLVPAHAYRPCVSHRSKKVAGRVAAGSRLLKIVLPAVPCRQGRPTQCLKPRAENARIGSDPSKAHRIGSH